MSFDLVVKMIYEWVLKGEVFILLKQPQTQPQKYAEYTFETTPLRS